MQITFEQIPETLGLLLSKMEKLEHLFLLQQKGSPSKTDQEQLLIIQDAAKFLRLSVPTIYGLVSSRKIPHMKKGKRLYFSTKALTKWLHDTEREAIL